MRSCLATFILILGNKKNRDQEREQREEGNPQANESRIPKSKFDVACFIQPRVKFEYHVVLDAIVVILGNVSMLRKVCCLFWYSVDDYMLCEVCTSDDCVMNNRESMTG